MAGLDVAGSAVGIASLGIQVCQGIMTFYNHWRSRDEDLKTTYACINDLSKTLIRLKDTIQDPSVEHERGSRVRNSLESCEDGVLKLRARWNKLRDKEEPLDWRQKAFTELRKIYYPFKASTLAKIRENVADIRGNLALAIQALQLDVAVQSHKQLNSIAAETQRISHQIADVRTQGILTWLGAPEPATNHDEAREKHQVGTGDWLFESPVYQKWKSSFNSILWLNGKAGSGKTILCSTVINDLATTRSNPEVQVLYFYFSFSDQQKQGRAGLFASLVAQLAHTDLVLERLSQEKTRESKPSIQLLQSILQLALSDGNKRILVLDALDEVPYDNDERLKVMRWLKQITHSDLEIQTLVTSRNLLEIQEYMDDMKAHSLSIDNAVANADIRRYVVAELENHPRLCSLPATVKAKIEQTLQAKADGMFRWAFCQLEGLKSLKSTRPKFIEQQLGVLPKDLDATYARMLEAMEDMYAPLAKKALRWLCFETEPLTLEELNDACLIDLESGFVDEDDRGGDVGDLLRILGSLISVYEGKDGRSDVAPSESAGDEQMTWEELPCAVVHSKSRVRLAHFSVKEYLLSSRVLREFCFTPQIDLWTLGQSCALYIIEYSRNKKKASTKADLESYPFLLHSSKHWFKYLHGNERQEDIQYDRRLLRSKQSCDDWLIIFDPDWPWSSPFEERITEPSTDLYYASSLGLVALSSTLIASGSNVDAQGGYHGYALTAAAVGGHREVVELLLDRGANVNAEGGDDGYALTAAALGGQREVVELLLDRGANINAEGGEYGHALTAAAFVGYREVVELLLDRGANINAERGEYGHALTAAAFVGYREVVELLLDRGANVNAEGGDYGSALTAAAFVGYREVVELLLDRGANVNAEGGDYGSALTAAAFVGHREVVELLLDRGANVNAEGGVYGSALMTAARWGYREMVELLLNRGANVNAEGGYDGYALITAARWGYREVVELLLNRGANINAQGSDDGYALTTAAMSGQRKVVELLLDRGANINAQGGRNGHALTAAVRWGHREVIELLLDRGANINAQGGRDGHALTIAAMSGQREVVELLVDRGANINAQGGRYGYALTAAAVGEHREIVELLLDRGAEVNAIGGKAGSPLMASVGDDTIWSPGSKEVMELLLKHGANTDTRHEGRTALEIAARDGRIEFVQLLLRYGADVFAQGDGPSALELAEARGHTEVSKVLREAMKDGRLNGSATGAVAEPHTTVLKNRQHKSERRLSSKMAPHLTAPTIAHENAAVGEENFQ